MFKQMSPTVKLYIQRTYFLNKVIGAAKTYPTSQKMFNCKQSSISECINSLLKAIYNIT